jgi:hypothetical protein
MVLKDLGHRTIFHTFETTPNRRQPGWLNIGCRREGCSNIVLSLRSGPLFRALYWRAVVVKVSAHMHQEAAQMLRHDADRIQRIVDGDAPDLGVKSIGPELIQHLNWAAEALESDQPPQ